MRRRPPRKIDRRTAEQMLRGVPADPHDPLVDVLAAAAAPPRAGELAGEHAAVAAFREAVLAPVARPERGSMIKTVIAKVVTLKAAAAAAVALTGLGGVALAASTGAVPTPGGGHAPDVRPAPAHATARPSPAAGGRDASPSPSLVGLCRAYTAGAGTNQGKALDSPAFTALVTAAGGDGKVAGYCAAILGARPGGAPSRRPAGAPAGHPTGPPAAHPTGPPAAHPTGAPDAHPTGPPTADPTGPPTARPTSAPTAHPTGAPTAQPTRGPHR